MLEGTPPVADMSSRGDMVGCGELSCIKGERVSMKLLKLGLGRAGETIMELTLPGCC